VSARPTTVVWFRRDLRVADHPALIAAAARGATVCLFVVDPGILGRRHHRAPARLRFLRAGLEALDGALRELGGRLVIRHGDPAVVVPRVAAEAGADRVDVTRDVSPLGRARDRRVREALAAQGMSFQEHGGDLAVPPESLPGPEGHGYRVFTPFYRAWQKTLVLPAHVPPPERLGDPGLVSSGPAGLPDGAPLIPAGPDAARERLVAFAAGHDADDYRDDRDFVADDATSRLSPYLRFGMCTGTQVGRAIGLPGPVSLGVEAFWRQVAWREFFHHLLWWRPHAVHTALQDQYRGIRWDNDPAQLDAWRRGLTGYPLVDAAMRQLADTGWIHNRARMVAASFLVKDLLIDWRQGETVFMQGLLDGDPASNNGGWQWVASTGTDAAPYFRVMNPVRQAKRFDPEGIYVKRYVPELRRVPEHHIHEPWLMDPELQRRIQCRIGIDYPAPIVDHIERQRLAIARYREAAAAPSAG
jgi:deoxyribodipyrimidine photo-lyase